MKVYINRMMAFPKQVEGYMDLLAYGSCRMGVPASKSMLGNVPSRLKELLDSNMDELREPLKGKDIAPEIAESVDQAIENCFKHSVRRLENFVNEFYMDRAREEPGVRAVRNGEKVYEECLRFHTTTMKSAQEIHDLGLQEVARIEARLGNAPGGGRPRAARSPERWPRAGPRSYLQCGWGGRCRWEGPRWRSGQCDPPRLAQLLPKARVRQGEVVHGRTSTAASPFVASSDIGRRQLHGLRSVQKPMARRLGGWWPRVGEDYPQYARRASRAVARPCLGSHDSRSGATRGGATRSGLCITPR